MKMTYDALEDWFILPKPWNGEKDIAFFDDRLGEPENYYVEVFRRIAEAHEDCCKVLISAHNYFVSHSSSPAPANHNAAGESTSLEWILVRVLNWAALHSQDQRYLDRMAECADQYLFALKKREGLQLQIALGKELTWLYPLVQLNDLLLSAAFELEEAMICEYDDYEEPPA